MAGETSMYSNSPALAEHWLCALHYAKPRKSVRLLQSSKSLRLGISSDSGSRAHNLQCKASEGSCRVW